MPSLLAMFDALIRRAIRDWRQGGGMTWITRLALALVVVGVGLLIARFPLSWIFLLVVGSIAAVTVLLQPMWGVYLLALAIPFGSVREIPLAGISLGVVDVLSAFVVAAWLAQMVAKREIRLFCPPLLIPLLLFVGVQLLSLLVTTSLILSLKEIAKWFEVVVIYLFIAHRGDARCARWLWIALLLAGSASALLGIYQFLAGVGPPGFLLFGRFMRAYGTFRQPNPYAGYLGLSLPLAVGPLLVGWPQLLADLRRRDWQHVLPGALAVVALGLMGLALLMSWSRGGWLGAAVAFAAMLLLSGHRGAVLGLSFVVLVALFLVLGGLGVLPPALLQRVATALPYASNIDLRTVEINDDNWALIERMAHWQAGWRMFAAHPWLGVGMGNYAVVYPQYALPRWQDPLGHAHNYHLNIMAEAGLVGLGAYVILWLAAFGWVVGAVRRTAGVARGIPLAALGVLVHLNVHNAFDNLFVQGMTLQLALVFGLLYLASRGERATDATMSEV